MRIKSIISWYYRSHFLTLCVRKRLRLWNNRSHFGSSWRRIRCSLAVGFLFYIDDGDPRTLAQRPCPTRLLALLCPGTQHVSLRVVRRGRWRRWQTVCQDLFCTQWHPGSVTCMSFCLFDQKGARDHSWFQKLDVVGPIHHRGCVVHVHQPKTGRWVDCCLVRIRVLRSWLVRSVSRVFVLSLGYSPHHQTCEQRSRGRGRERGRDR